MNKIALFAFVFLLFSGTITAQEEKKEKDLDSVQQDLDRQGVKILRDSVVVEKKKINPLAPSKAAFYSAIFPGLGQIYNRRYWKVPLVYAAIGTGIYAYVYNDQQYNRFRDAFKSRQAGFNTDEFSGNDPDSGIRRLEEDDLQDFQEKFQRDRDLALLITIGLYALNIIDANVDAHLKQFNVDDKLSMDFKPYLEYNPITADPNYGMAFIIKF